MNAKIILSLLIIGLVFASGCTQQANINDSDDSGDVFSSDIPDQIDENIIEEGYEVDIGEIDDF